MLALTAGCLDFIRGDGPLEFEAALATPSDDALAETGYEEAAIDGEEFDETVEFGVEREIHASFWLASYTKQASLEDLSPDADAIEPDDSDDADEVEEEDGGGLVPDDIDEELLEEVDDPEDLIDGELADDESPSSESGVDDGLGGSPAGLSDAEYTFLAVSSPGIEVAGQSLNPLEGMGSAQLIEEFLDQADADVEDLEQVETLTLEVLGDQREVDRLHGTVTQDGMEVTLEITIGSFTHEEDFLVLAGIHPAAADGEAANVERLMESVEHPLETP
ncbi:hypothetical protein B1756_01675 [Natrarchaeobaculum aegyptiacum]|uniref:Uncharacterized protein n=1 Tax=Natrarchaeobaculum aegyptiacum TaxID=745377 RepID=A0A2Z2HNT3_9EURY|nr:hypothetical protein B1756_01675 [Natrarchaeobaculum aegyptiacum]